LKIVLYTLKNSRFESKKELTEFIRKKSLEYGFSITGFSRVLTLPEEYEQLKKWISCNYNGNMKWIERDIDKRVNPLMIMPEAKSIIALGVNYYNDVRYSGGHEYGKIARYALGKDYHKVIKKLLKKLCDEIRENTNAGEFKIFVDSGAILEKAFAARAGIGWIGKNTLLINKIFGSYLFLGLILTDLELEYDKIQENLCGNCNLCLDSCPHNALEEPYILNVNKCISYLTQYGDENSHNNNKWIYGCDICQEVCPWNKENTNTGIPEFFPVVKNEILLDEEITENDFERIYGDTPIKKIGFKKFNQNREIAKLNNKF
jgi:epoxyqueuosine reductase